MNQSIFGFKSWQNLTFYVLVIHNEHPVFLKLVSHHPKRISVHTAFLVYCSTYSSEMDVFDHVIFHTLPYSILICILGIL